ncbi:54S ribosomal protein img2, mitochondrial [Acrasis kona]|uniref:Large ribosomal subunit protein mL49 n=1 Tax=Acrasis kona TaxID=1008807 RepID=A0AAW2YRW1_9EUKA
MPFFRNRRIPALAKDVAKRATPNHILMNHLVSPKVNLIFPLHKDFCDKVLNQIETTDNPSGFEHPLGKTEKLPFSVARTNSGSLPVYIDFRAGRTRTDTLLRKIEGDVRAVAYELTKITGCPTTIKPATVVVKGHHSRIVRLWLRSLGF